MTRRLRSGQIGGFGATESVDANIAFRDYDFDLFKSTLVVATPTPTSYRLVTTNPVEAGIWSVTVAIIVTGSNSGTELGTDVKFDGVSQTLILTSAAVPGGGFLLSATATSVWVAGTHTVEYLVSQPSGPGDVSAIQCSTTWVRER